MTIEKIVGSRAEVFHGTAKHTSGGLNKDALVKNKRGRIVSRKRSASAKSAHRLECHGFFTKKGKFGYIKKEPRKRGCKKTLKRLRKI